MRRARHAAAALALAGALGASPALAGPTNPNISIIGQPFARLTDDPNDIDRERLQFEPGEVELVFDDYLNPYAKAFFTLALGEDGLELEEGYFDLVRGLPLGLALRGGQFRVGFGKENPTHPHTYPFAERFRVLAAYLPGEEGYIETGASLSKLFALPADRSLTLAVDALTGDSFRIERGPSASPDDPLLDPSGIGDRSAETRLAVNGRAAWFAELGELSALEVGASVTHGTTNVAAAARSTIVGLDAKAKLWTSPEAYLLLQAEGLWLDRPVVGWESGAGYTTAPVEALGGYVYGDYNWARRYNAGLGWERFEEPTVEGGASWAMRAYTGLALLEESTAFRLDWERFFPATGDPFNTTTLRAIFSLGGWWC
ncbi:MAG TPA: hypothetical protein VNM87_10775 [Candidatus Udaeobacter sp.]|nr:hypothetical protein [Candidatus Udaeobacter sp.]